MMEQILVEQGFQQSGCTTNECMVEVGKLIGVENIVKPKGIGFKQEPRSSGVFCFPTL